MRVFAGTSGFSYKEWKGRFYPDKIKNADMLAFYGARIPAVEINNTFYRMPKREVLEKWASEVPEGFRFVLKASRRITHLGRLKEPEDSVRYLASMAEGLGEKRGPYLFQLPPNMRKNTERLRGLVACLPEGTRIALETRHPSWDDDEVRSILFEAGHAWCGVDREEDVVEGEPPPPRVLAEVPEGGAWGYLRLRRCDYTDEDLQVYADRIRARGWTEVFVFFKHEDDGTGPELALRFLERFTPSERGASTDE